MATEALDLEGLDRPQGSLSCPECEFVAEGNPNARGKGSLRYKLNQHLQDAHGIVPVPRNHGKADGAWDYTPEEPPAKVGWFARTFGKKGTAPGEVRPKKAKARKTGRTSLAPAGSLAWMGAGMLADKAHDYPVARTFQFQSGVAGDVIDRALAGTVVDKLVQPLIGGADKYTDLATLAAFPVLVAIHERKPTQATEAALRLVVRQNLVALAKAMKVAKAQEKAMAEAVEELDAAGLGLDANDPVGNILAMIFAPGPETVAAEANGTPVGVQ